MTRRQYLDNFALNYRIRVTKETEGNRMLHWAAQLEWLDPNGGWVWIARFDTAGALPHRDRNRITHHEIVSLPKNPGRALQAATQDLRENAEMYNEAYLAAKAAGREAWS